MPTPMAPSAPNSSPIGAPELTPLQMQIFLKHLMGWPNWRIALSLGWPNQARVTQVLGEPAVVAALADARKAVINSATAVMERINASAPAALDVVEELMHNSKNDRVRLTAALDMLDRAGHAPTKKLEVGGKFVSASFNVHALSAEDLASLEAIAEKAARASVMGPAFSAGTQEIPIPVQVGAPLDAEFTDTSAATEPSFDPDKSTPDPNQKGVPDDGYEPI